MTDAPAPADDLVYGARAIGDILALSQRKAFHRLQSRTIPGFKVGSTWCARRSTLLRWLENAETLGPRRVVQVEIVSEGRVVPAGIASPAYLGTHLEPA